MVALTKIREAVLRIYIGNSKKHFGTDCTDALGMAWAGRGIVGILDVWCVCASCDVGNRWMY